MNRTGHYEWNGRTFVRVSSDAPTLKPHVYFNKGNVAQYDPSARTIFHDRDDKRVWLKRWGMKEGGVIRNTDKRWDGPVKNATKPTLAQRKDRAQRRAWIQSQGGVQGLLARTRTGGV